MSVVTDCTCGGPRRPDGDGERWWLVCVKCGDCSPPPRALPDAEWLRRVRVVVSARRGNTA